METTSIASSQAGDACIIALDPSVADALRIGGTASATLDCGARVNSTSNQGIRTNGGGCITASSIYVAGGSTGSCIDPTAVPGMEPLDDPCLSG